MYLLAVVIGLAITEILIRARKQIRLIEVLKDEVTLHEWRLGERYAHDRAVQHAVLNRLDLLSILNRSRHELGKRIPSGQWSPEDHQFQRLFIEMSDEDRQLAYQECLKACGIAEYIVRHSAEDGEWFGSADKLPPDDWMKEFTEFMTLHRFVMWKLNVDKAYRALDHKYDFKWSGHFGVLPRVVLFVIACGASYALIKWSMALGAQ